MDSILTTPGQYTDQQDPRDFAWMVAHGYEWLSYQAYNPRLDGAKKDFDLRPARRAGFKSVGVWGVTYGKNDSPDRAAFFADGKALGEQAVKLGADHVHVDAEQCAKFTVADRGLAPIVEGLRAGGWQGPLHFNTLGAPSNPKTKDNPNGNDFGMDIQTFLETGGGVITQAYLNISPDYLPKLCVAYWRSMGVPDSKLNVMIEPSTEGTPISGAGWVPLLQAAGVKRNFSIFMSQFGTGSDYEALDVLAKAPPPPPPVPMPTPNEVRGNIVVEADRWLTRQTTTQRMTRMRVVRRIAQAANDDPKWNSVRGKISDLLDNAGIPL